MTSHKCCSTCGLFLDKVPGYKWCQCKGKLSGIPTMEQNPNGLHQRYNVAKADGSPVDPNALYFVLKLSPLADADELHVDACRNAARAYCDYIFASASPDSEPLRSVAEELWMLVNQLDAEDEAEHGP